MRLPGNQLWVDYVTIILIIFFPLCPYIAYINCGECGHTFNIKLKKLIFCVFHSRFFFLSFFLKLVSGTVWFHNIHENPQITPTYPEICSIP